MNLKEYMGKRDFSKTPEPSGKKAVIENNIFVIQKHDARRLHYDLRLEESGVLKSWALPKGPSMDPSIKRLAVMTEDHPLDYANFEGTIPKGQYGAGAVIVWDKGNYKNISKIDEKSVPFAKALKKGHLTFWLDGKKLRGGFHLIKTSRNDNWLLIKAADGEADRGSDILVSKPYSVLSGKSIEEISNNLK